MSLIVVGLSYKTATLEARERASIPHNELEDCLKELCDCKGVTEAVVLSTCNRVEIYLNAQSDRLGENAAVDFFKNRSGEHYDADDFYIRRGVQMVHHLYRVVCSLDSQVLGEGQILGQIRGAFEFALEKGTCSETLEQLFKSALSLGKKVRSKTSIGTDSVSLSTVAFKAALKAFPDMSSRRVMFVGVGQMAELALKYVLEAGTMDIIATSRSLKHAQSFGRECGALAIPFEDRYEAIAQSDVVFVATASQEPVVCADELMQARTKLGLEDKRMIFIDQGVPRDVEWRCSEIEGVSLENLETLSSVVDEGLAERMEAVREVERLIADAEESFFNWMQEQTVTPTIKGIYAKADKAVATELARTCKAMVAARGEELSEEEIEILRHFGTAVSKKILHGPTVRLRKEAHSPASYYYTSSARYMFGLDTHPDGKCVPCKDKRCLNGEKCPHSDTY